MARRLVRSVRRFLSVLSVRNTAGFDETNTFERLFCCHLTNKSFICRAIFYQKGLRCLWKLFFPLNFNGKFNSNNTNSNCVACIWSDRWTRRQRIRAWRRHTIFDLFRTRALDNYQTEYILSIFMINY